MSYDLQGTSATLSSSHYTASFLNVCAPLPALVMGVLLMRAHNVPASVWMQNLLAGIILTVIGAAVFWATPRRWPPRVWLVIGAFSVLLLGATLFQDDVDGVTRWIPVGPLNLHAAAVVLPLLLIAHGSIEGIAALGIGVLVILVLQPDAAQASAFGAGLVALLMQRRPGATTWLALLAVAVLVTWSWFRRDPLLPLPHVEGMLGLARESGALWLVSSLIALALLPVPFFVAPRHDHESTRIVPLSLGVYFVVVCLAPLFGAFPVPLLGYGLSPIVGYFLALGWTMSRQRRAYPDE